MGIITVEVEAEDEESGIDNVEIYINGQHNADCYWSFVEQTYDWLWDQTRWRFWIRGEVYCELKVVAKDRAGNKATDELKLYYFNIT